MAFDKVVDSTALDTALTATADAIREKTGTADPITWLEELGFSEAIAGISAGGGVKIATGTYTVASNQNDVIIEHDFGEIPDVVLTWADQKSSTQSGYMGYMLLGVVTPLDGLYAWKCVYTSGSSKIVYSNSDKEPGVYKSFFSVSDTQVGFWSNSASSQAVAGLLYRYILIKGVSLL